ncbi:hypothetical protein M427DRAFT_275205 [Gonapodya prolifera JEL478]|uniref:K Homology domain-containing protein n=1 Tax=Gonapodya prolifera (strain JEL478) TaxID=1344416 RepID=A0A139AY07_GONPJ|nr:hypothetical protein M427DRAFT_275205 [Gonapodya prolifera JEL478]|eukprot:KXS21631.1 hypothetical protein M427DRAFT_275205 [Gonapodya prolifera JEL478]
MADSIAKAPVDFSAALKKAQEIAQKLGRSGPSEPGVPSSSWSSQEPSRQEDEDRFRREPREPRDRPDDYHRERDRRRSRSRSRSPGRRYDDSRDRDRDRYRGRDEDRSRSRYGLGSDEQKTRDQNRPGYGLSAAGAKQEEMTVPSSVVGLIIGKGGTNLKEIESDTKAKVQFKGEQTDPERHVTITGTAEAVDAARKRIQGVIADHNDRQATRFLQNTTSPVQSMPPIHYGGGGDRGGQGPPSRGPPMGMGDTSTTVAIPKSTVGLVIGRSGETVQRLSRESGTRINVTPDSQSDPNSNDRIVTIVGPPQAVEEAKRLIDEIVSTARENQGMRPNASMGMGMGVTGPGMLSDVMQVPSEYVGTIIGKQGSEIRNLESLTGCRINVQQAANGLVTRDISLRGTPEAIAYAKQLIEEKIEQAANVISASPLAFPRLRLSRPRVTGCQRRGLFRTLTGGQLAPLTDMPCFSFRIWFASVALSLSS